MTECATITASRASLYPAVLPRKAPGETERIENDISADIDCDGSGTVTITSSTWTIDPADDDSMLTLGVAFEQGLITLQPYSGGTPGKSYRVHNRVITSDGLDLTFTVQVVIAETVMVAFG